ncbi:basic proline-rich protein-like [Calypte anna]|uniref:basic proline-rich protein-like n=1 Tax=Calypte anna TaxID=9244 RepID=UPI0011C460DD|nr:basic proline-rich protein-like [Calypte anna]
MPRASTRCRSDGNARLLRSPAAPPTGAAPAHRKTGGRSGTARRLHQRLWYRGRCKGTRRKQLRAPAAPCHFTATPDATRALSVASNRTQTSQHTQGSSFRGSSLAVAVLQRFAAVRGSGTGSAAAHIQHPLSGLSRRPPPGPVTSSHLLSSPELRERVQPFIARPRQHFGRKAGARRPARISSFSRPGRLPSRRCPLRCSPFCGASPRRRFTRSREPPPASALTAPGLTLPHGGPTRGRSRLPPFATGRTGAAPDHGGGHCSTNNALDPGSPEPPPLPRNGDESPAALPGTRMEPFPDGPAGTTGLVVPARRQARRDLQSPGPLPPPPSSAPAPPAPSSRPATQPRPAGTKGSGPTPTPPAALPSTQPRTAMRDEAPAGTAAPSGQRERAGGPDPSRPLFSTAALQGAAAEQKQLRLCGSTSSNKTGGKL